MAHRYSMIVTTGVAMAGLALSACGSGSSSSTSSSSESSSESSAPAVTIQWGNASEVDATRSGAPNPAAAPSSVTSACTADNSPKIKSIQDAGVLNWGIGVSPPFGFSATTGSWEGVEAENAVELASLLGVKPSIIAYDYGVMTTALQSNRADIVGAQLFVTPARQEVIDFSSPYYKSGQIYYVLESSKYQTIADLDTASNLFVYGTGGAQGGLATKYTPKAKQQQVPLQGQLIPYQVIATGRAQSTMGESAAWPVLKAKFTSPALAAIGKQGRVSGDLPSAEDMLDPFDVAFGIPKNDAGWKACVDAWVQWGTGSADGPMQQRVDYWLRHQTEAGG